MCPVLQFNGSRVTPFCPTDSRDFLSHFLRKRNMLQIMHCCLHDHAVSGASLLKATGDDQLTLTEVAACIAMIRETSK